LPGGLLKEANAKQTSFLDHWIKGAQKESLGDSFVDSHGCMGEALHACMHVEKIDKLSNGTPVRMLTRK
jgi:hypothetical protein